ncbi:MAG: hypothetical protein IJO67_05500 [Clostridia bacterium]|nr:hypothetical protein [Clostridia bacterium]
MDVRQYIISYVETQTNVNLERYRTDFAKRWERPDEIIVEYKEIPKSLWRRVELLASKQNPKIRMEHVGVWGMMIALIE